MLHKISSGFKEEENGAAEKEREDKTEL